MDNLDLTRFFASVNAKLESYDQFMALVTPQLAPEFNIIECLCPDENRLSSIIAMLLDPQGEHGQGDRFLRLFMEEISFDDDISCNKSSREVEALTRNIQNPLRRIDILIHFDGFNLAIENKPWACDQDDQIKDYLEELENRKNRYLLIYLSPEGVPPKTNSISNDNLRAAKDSGKLKIISYKRHIINWIERCISECKSARVRAFLQEFSEYIKKQFCGEHNIMESNLIIEHSIKCENIRAAAAVGIAWPGIAEKLIDNLADLVMDAAGLSANLTWVKDVTFGYNKTNSGFSFRKNNWSNYRIKFCFENCSAKGLFVGVEKNKEWDPNASDNSIAEKLDINYKQKGYPNTWWVWWEYMDWSANDEDWAGISVGGETVKMIADKLNTLIVRCADEISKNESELCNHKL